MKKILILIVLILSFIIPVSAGTVSYSLNNGSYNYVPEPRLKSPIYDTVTITNNQPLEFTWFNDYADTFGFILKIYKGYNMYGDSLLLKENLSSGANSFKVKADLFENNKVYTWSLVRVSLSGYKSGKSFNSFKVIKK